MDGKIPFSKEEFINFVSGAKMCLQQRLSNHMDIPILSQVVFDFSPCTTRATSASLTGTSAMDETRPCPDVCGVLKEGLGSATDEKKILNSFATSFGSSVTLLLTSILISLFSERLGVFEM